MKKLVIEAKVKLEIALNEPIKRGKQIMKAGEIP